MVNPVLNEQTKRPSFLILNFAAQSQKAVTAHLASKQFTAFWLLSSSGCYLAPSCSGLVRCDRGVNS